MSDATCICFAFLRVSYCLVHCVFYNCCHVACFCIHCCQADRLGAAFVTFCTSTLKSLLLQNGLTFCLVQSSDFYFPARLFLLYFLSTSSLFKLVLDYVLSLSRCPVYRLLSSFSWECASVGIIDIVKYIKSGCPCCHHCFTVFLQSIYIIGHIHWWLQNVL